MDSCIGQLELKPLAIETEGHQLTYNVTSTVRIDDIPDTEHTILDRVVQEEGCVLRLVTPVDNIFGETVDSVYLPPIKHVETEGVVLIHQVGLLFNNVVRIDSMVRAGELEKSCLQKSLYRYQQAAILMLSGKSGHLNRLGTTNRIRHSLRAVAIPSAAWPPDWLGVPGIAMDSAGKTHGALCMAVRFPSIWDGSVEVFRARKSCTNCIEIHPLLHEQFGLDHDGDCMSMYWVPEDAECQREAEARVLSFLRDKTTEVTWPRALRRHANDLVQNLTDMENVKKETKLRLPKSGFSISPADILCGEDSPSTSKLEAIVKKGLQKDNLKIAKGLDKEEFTKRILNTNRLNLVMKIFMGPVGALANRIKLMCENVSDEVQRSGMDISQHIQQALLDAKHAVGRVEDQDFMKATQLLGKSSGFVMPGELAEKLASAGIPAKTSLPFLCHVYCTRPALMALEQHRNRLTAKEMQEICAAFVNIAKNYGSVDKAYRNAFTLLVNRVTGSGDKLAWRKTLGRYFHADSLNGIVEEEFPVYSLVSQQITSLRRVNMLVERVFRKGANDPKGICKQTMNMLRGGTVHGSSAANSTVNDTAHEQDAVPLRAEREGR